jgi:hypothetical protein
LRSVYHLLKEEGKMNLHDLIAQLACELYVESGKLKGRDLENWLEAEWIVRNRYKSPEDLLDYPEAS